MTTTNDPTAPASAPTFTTSRAVLADALATVGLAISTRPAVPLLGAVLLEGRDDGRLTLSGFDYETVITVTIPDAATVAGRVLIDHSETVRVLSALVKGKSKRQADATPVTITAPAPDAPRMSVNGYTVPVTAYPLGDYPTLPDAPPPVAQFNRGAFTAELGRVLCAVGDDVTLPTLTGVNMELSDQGLTLAATDQHRLAVAHVPTVPGSAAAPSTMLVLGSLLDKVAKKLTGEHLTLGHDRGLVSLSSGAVTAVTRPIGSAFVKYRARIPSPPASFTADRAALLALVEQAQAISKAKREANPLVTITVDAGALVVAPLLSERSTDVAPPELTAKTDGYPNAIRFAFNPAYLTDALAAITGDTATVHTQTIPTKPVVITETGARPGDGTAYRHVLMPVRLS
ncbi:DNA polymerase-3 subunit beta [Murinocardiopsis flavida]|uniref:DNA polymerase-3 subunit beta n=1 Tax=Murinocardiopsis flavida TaxID=645275 RepID=A0A2P8CYB4_9ACTN|nr:DNA polymerase III subunit beta [Murinocardiopsis flavida]PSK89949.1 DNA polymerase-3 subunit beta [Murinocardiopsis flavida]